MSSILITGNMGYIGPVITQHLKEKRPDYKIYGYDCGFFTSCLLQAEDEPEKPLEYQFIGDIRDLAAQHLQHTTSIIHLAAISNDPMGSTYESATHDINCKATLKLAQHARDSGVKNFIFASSCSIYGASSDAICDETAPLVPLTAYARSKVEAEEGLEKLATPEFKVTCLRFATACGFSPRIRLDLVLNDFVASALVNKTIEILSDGTPWRPLIDVNDMAIACDWALHRDGKQFLSLNTGRNDWNYQIRDLASKVAETIKETTIRLNPQATPDKRSYRVDFTKFETQTKKILPPHNIEDTIKTLADQLQNAKFSDHNFRSSHFIRLVKLKELRQQNRMDDTLRLIK